MISMIIKNRKELLSHGNIRGREAILEVLEYAINSVDAYEATKKRVFVKNNELRVDDLNYDLSKIENIYVVGGGKATFSVAKALDEVLGERIKGGCINIKGRMRDRLKHIKVVEAGHPIPNEKGYEGAKEIMEIVKEAKKSDLVFCVITGGASALMPLPAGKISLEDKKKVTDQLLKCGATISEINTIRKHVSAIKGGKLAQRIHPAEIINLIVIDEVAGLPWGPTVPDTTTFKDAIRVLKKYSLWDKVPNSIRMYLRRGLFDSSLETAKLEDFKDLKVNNIILTDNEIMCQAAKKRAEELGFNSLILSTMIEGESREIGAALASIAKEVEKSGRPIESPSILIMGGETTVNIVGECGEGGPSQELVLGASLKIHESEKIAIASIDTDGTDGPTDIAGGIVDGYTMGRAKRNGLDIFKNLMTHNSSEILMKLQDTIYTGYTGTNVMDLNIVAIID